MGNAILVQFLRVDMGFAAPKRQNDQEGAKMGAHGPNRGRLLDCPLPCIGTASSLLTPCFLDNRHMHAGRALAFEHQFSSSTYFNVD